MIKGYVVDKSEFDSMVNELGLLKQNLGFVGNEIDLIKSDLKALKPKGLNTLLARIKSIEYWIKDAQT